MFANSNQYRAFPAVPNAPDQASHAQNGRSQLRDLSGAENDRFETFCAEPREVLPAERLKQGSLVMVRRGVVLRQRRDGGGNPVAVDIIGTGGAFMVSGRDEIDETRSTCFAVDRSLYCVLDERQLMDELRNDPANIAELHRLHCDIAYRLERLSDARGRSNVRARVAATLCTLADTLNPHTGRRTRLPSALLQRDIGTLASTRHESVCRILRDLSGSGLVQHGPDGIQILNHQALADL